METVALDSIVIGERVRKDLGDIAALAESIKRHGLLHPIVINGARALIAGHRRIEAARLIGMKEIPVTVLNIEDLLSAERDENSERKNFTPTEAVAIGRLIEAREKSAVDERRRAGWNKRRARKNGIPDVGNLPESVAHPEGVRGVVGKAVGMSGSTYARARDVVDAAESDPDKFGDLPQMMDESGQVAEAYNEMRRRKGNPSAPKKRHAVHRKTHHPKPNRIVERATWALAGICDSLNTVDASQLDPEKSKQWVESLKKSAAHINRIARNFLNV